MCVATGEWVKDEKIMLFSNKVESDYCYPHGALSELCRLI